MNDQQREKRLKLLGFICRRCEEVLHYDCRVCGRPTWCKDCGGYVGRFFTKKDIERREQAIFNGRKLKHTYMDYGCDCCMECENMSEVLDEDRLEEEGWC